MVQLLALNGAKLALFYGRVKTRPLRTAYYDCITY
ncbi:MAG: hypothetical protein JWQ90_1374 [Hydrocarboniphaga sp.]|nr:hypothetical protein [Hydrocarboniphaga sp.]